MNTRRLAAAIGTLSKLNPLDPKVASVVSDIESMTRVSSSDVDLSGVKKEIARLHQAAAVPAKNYARVMSIMAGLNKAVDIANQERYASLRPQIARLVTKVAGIFSLCDTADELSAHSLEEIESAVHKLYSGGKLNDPDTYNFSARGKGHHSKAEQE